MATSQNQSAPINIKRPNANAAPDFSSSSLNHDSSGANSLSSSAPSTTAISSRKPPRARQDQCHDCRRHNLECEFKDEHRVCVACRRHGRDCVFDRAAAGAGAGAGAAGHLRKRKLSHDDGNGNGIEMREGERLKRRSPDPYDYRRERIEHSLVTSSSATNSLIEGMANIGHSSNNLMKRTLGLQNNRYSQHIGPTTDFEPSLIDLSPFDPEDETFVLRGTLRKVGANDTFLLLPDHATQGYEHIAEDADAIEDLVKPNGPRLISLYFEIIHPSFPILQKTVFLEKYNCSYRAISPACLAVIYILALNWWHHDVHLRALPRRPDIHELERLARVTLTDAMFRPKLSTVQAGLLLSQRPQGDQWAPTAQLVAIAQELGLHLDCTHWRIPPWERGLRKRLAWGLYMQDKWGALIHGRPSHIYVSNWAAPELSLHHDFPPVSSEAETPAEAAEIERGRLLFIYMVKLTQILAEVLDTFYTLQAMARIEAAGPLGGAQLVLHLAQPIQVKLREWLASLPARCRMDGEGAEGPMKDTLSSVGSLHLHYYATEITLHRRIIRALSSKPVSGVSTPLPSQPLTRSQSETTIHSRLYSSKNYHSSGIHSSGIPPSTTHHHRTLAKSHLISSMSFINRLQPQHLRAFWYFASKTNFALIGTFGSLLWATAEVREEAEWYARRLGEYRWSLGVCCMGVEGTLGAGKGVAKTGEGEEGDADAVMDDDSSSERPAITNTTDSAPPPTGLTAFAMTMLDISTGLLTHLPEKPAFSDREPVSRATASTAFTTRATSMRDMSMWANTKERMSFLRTDGVSGPSGLSGGGGSGSGVMLDGVEAARARTERVLMEQGKARWKAFTGMEGGGDDSAEEEEEEGDEGEGEEEDEGAEEEEVEEVEEEIDLAMQDPHYKSGLADTNPATAASQQQ